MIVYATAAGMETWKGRNRPYRGRQSDRETFNLAPVSPVSLGEFIPSLAKKTGRRFVEARSILGFTPKYLMVDEAAAAK